MHLFQFLHTLKSQFWNTPDTSGPTIADVLRFWDTPRPLRAQTRAKPNAYKHWNHPERLTVADAESLASFWSSHYAGEDWVFRPETQWVASILADPSTTVLAVYSGGANRQIVGSIVCRGLAKGSFRLGSLVLPNAYIIEGLCLDPAWRGQHLAGWLIAWIDHIVNASGPQAFFWSREAPPRDITYIASHKYSYLPLKNDVKLVGNSEIVEISWTDFQHIWASHAQRWNHLEIAAFPTSLPDDSLYVWRLGANYAVVSDTRRRTRTRTLKSETIWEVQFCGNLCDPLAKLDERESEEKGEEKSEEKSEEVRKMLEAVGALIFKKKGSGLLFVTSAAWQGGCTQWSHPWIVGTAGYHTTYIYNYMPPAFHKMAPLFLRNEL